MSEFCLDSFRSMPKKSPDFSSIILSDFYGFCSFIFSHPLYFSYFVFFSPYLFKLVSFLSPLFLTTSLLLLALLTVSPGLLHDSSAYHNALDIEDDEFQHFEFEELEVYKIVFQGFTFEVRENDPDQVLEVEAQGGSAQALEEEPIDKCVIEGGSEAPTSNSDEALWPEIDQKVEEGLEEGFLKEEDENLSWEREEVKPISKESTKVAEQPSIRRGSKAIHKKTRGAKVSIDHEEFESINNGEVEDQYKTPKSLSSYPSFDSSLGSYGSMRKEKEWKRTLACKLFEERHNAEGGAEGMDMLWETYEAESTKMQLKSSKKGTKGIAESFEEDDDDEEEDGVQLCCLQALKFSAGKMNLGMGRPSFVRFSKAVKGMGWLHHVSKAKRATFH